MSPSKLACDCVLLLAAAPVFALCGNFGGDHIFLEGFDAAVPPVAGDLVITEIMADPVAVPDEDGEWFEMANISPLTLELCGCRLLNGISFSQLLLPLKIAPGQRAVLARNTDPAVNGGVIADGLLDRSLVNGSGKLVIQCHAVVEVVNWPGTMAGRSWSLDPDFTDPLLNDDPSAWCFPTMPAYNQGGDHGTPGQPNVPCASLGLPR